MSKCLNKVELFFFPDIMKPIESSKVLFWSCGELFIGTFSRGCFYCRGSRYFPDSWDYAPKEEPKF